MMFSARIVSGVPARGVSTRLKAGARLTIAIRATSHLINSQDERKQAWHQKGWNSQENGSAGSKKGGSGGDRRSGFGFDGRTMFTIVAPSIAAASALGLGLYGWHENMKASKAGCPLSIPSSAAAVQAAAVEYSVAEISKHKSREAGGVWVTYGENVYDITEFVEQHPGGEKIMLAAGGPLEPFWKIYTIHTGNECVFDILNDMIIGKVKKGEKFEANTKLEIVKGVACPYKADPDRHPAYTVNSQKPFDAEPPAEMLIHDIITPNDIFFVRNHLPVPELTTDSYRLDVNIPGENSVKISLNDLKTKFKKHTVTATLQCAGNRRGEMGKHKKIYGALSGHAAISTAVWGGVKLRDVLLAAGIKEDDPKIKHIVFEGWDKDGCGDHYGASIPVEKAMNSMGDVMLAYEMNGKELPRDHGYPVRVVCPGVIGARSVKWVKKITASEDECQSNWQKNDYRSTDPSASWNKFDVNTHHAIYEWPVQSVICSPAEGQKPKVHDGVMEVKGYAWSGGGNGIIRVDVSADQGKTWYSAELQQVTQRRYRMWAWTLWSCEIPIPEGQQKQDADNMELWCKAVDSSHNVQPDTINGIWNLRGFLNNTWHKVNVKPEFI